MTAANRLSVAIISYNVSEKLKTCLKSVSTFIPDCPVYVWDNGSTDDTETMIKHNFPSITFFKSPVNLFFAHGCNQLIRKCRTPYVLLMNADIFLDDCSVLDLITYMDNNPDCIAVSPAVRDSGRIRHMASGVITPFLCIARDSFAGKALRKTRWYHRAMFEETPSDAVFDAPKITNCCCVIRCKEFINFGGFSIGQILYWTEEEMAIRIYKTRFKQAVYGQSIVNHEHGSSSKKLPRELVRAIHVRDRITYMKKNFGTLAVLFVEIMLFIRPKIWNSISDYWCIVRYWKEMCQILKEIYKAQNET